MTGMQMDFLALAAGEYDRLYDIEENGPLCERPANCGRRAAFKVTTVRVFEDGFYWDHDNDRPATSGVAWQQYKADACPPGSVRVYSELTCAEHRAKTLTLHRYNQAYTGSRSWAQRL